MGGKEEEGRGTGRSDRRKVEMRERGGGRGGAKIKIGVGGGIQQACLRQCDMAHAINSGSAERPCLAICSGSGAFEGVGVTPPPTLTPLSPTTILHTHTHTDTIPPSSQSSPGRHPARPACISIKQLQANLLPCRAGGVKRGVERRLASL